MFPKLVLLMPKFKLNSKIKPANVCPYNEIGVSEKKFQHLSVQSFSETYHIYFLNCFS